MRVFGNLFHFYSNEVRFEADADPVYFRCEPTRTFSEIALQGSLAGGAAARGAWLIVAMLLGATIRDLMGPRREELRLMRIDAAAFEALVAEHTEPPDTRSEYQRVMDVVDEGR